VRRELDVWSGGFVAAFVRKLAQFPFRAKPIVHVGAAFAAACLVDFVRSAGYVV